MLEIVVVIMPPLPRGEQGEEKIIPTSISRCICSRAPNMGKRVDTERPVPQKHGAQEEADPQTGRAHREEHGECKDDGRDEPVLVKPHELGVLGKVFDA